MSCHRQTNYTFVTKKKVLIKLALITSLDTYLSMYKWNLNRMEWQWMDDIYILIPRGHVITPQN